MYKLSIIVPCYNEQENLLFLLKRASEIFDREDVEFILVNNGSTDNTYSILKELNIRFPWVKLVDVPVNLGYGYGILCGLENATGNVLSWTHADLQTDLADVLTAFAIYNKSNNNSLIVKGRRRRRPIIDTILTIGMQQISSLILGKRLVDINAQPKLFSSEFYTKFLKGVAPYDFSLDLFLLYIAQKNNYTIVDFPVDFLDRLYGEAKGGGADFITRIKIIKRTLKYIFKVRNNQAS